jgi:adenylylsulfate kinase
LFQRTVGKKVEVVHGNCPTLWLTGLSGAGKTTLALALQNSLKAQGYACAVVDGDELRRGLCSDLGFSPADRSENIRRAAELARTLNQAGLIAIVALISPLTADRERARHIIGAEAMFEVHMATPLATCEARDSKGLYKKARAGELADFTGVSAPYEAPNHPQLVFDTAALSVEDCVHTVLHLLKV